MRTVLLVLAAVLVVIAPDWWEDLAGVGIAFGAFYWEQVKVRFR